MYGHCSEKTKVQVLSSGFGGMGGGMGGMGGMGGWGGFGGFGGGITSFGGVSLFGKGSNDSYRYALLLSRLYKDAQVKSVWGSLINLLTINPWL